MTGPEHYLEAERLAELATNADDQMLALKAQVHATLALAAATAMTGYEGDRMHPADFEAWDRACGVPTEQPGPAV